MTSGTIALSLCHISEVLLLRFKEIILTDTTLIEAAFVLHHIV